MSYPIETKIAPKQSWFTPAESNAYYSTKYSRSGITIHWWGGGEAADQHDNIVNYFMAQGQQGIKSVNYVVSDIKITKMVEPDNVAFASQTGNPTTISIEFQPTLSDEGYKRGGWLISEMEKKYNHAMPLYPHSKWFATSCPGTIDLKRLRTEADKFKEIDMATKVDDGNIDLLYVSVLHRHAAQADKDARRGQDYLKAQTELYESKEWANQDQALKNPEFVPVAEQLFKKKS